MRKMEDKPSVSTKASALRWKILRQALLNRSSNQNPKDENFSALKHISRKTSPGFNLIPSQIVRNDDDVAKDSNFRNACVCYTLPIDGNPKVVLMQRVENCADLNDFEICNKYNVDNTGLVCQWPSEEVLAYFCLSHAELFRSKRVIELGSGYGLAGLVIAAATEATEVVISDGNPQVVDYIRRSIDANSGIFGSTEVKTMILHWDQEETSNLSGMFDVIVASDCTFFKEFHESLVFTVKLLLRDTETSEAIFLSPTRGNSLDKFLEKIEENGMHFRITENYDEEVWKHHQGFMNEDCTWPNYEKDHCYPLLVRITL